MVPLILTHYYFRIYTSSILECDNILWGLVPLILTHYYFRIYTISILKCDNNLW